MLVQLIYRPDNGEILGVHIFGLHAADLIHEASNAIALGTRIQVMNNSKLALNAQNPRLSSLPQLSCIYLLPHLQFDMDDAAIYVVLPGTLTNLNSTHLYMTFY